MMSAQTESSHAFETLNGLRSRWSDDAIPLGYRFQSFSPDVPVAQQRIALRNALDSWTSASQNQLNFIESSNPTLTVDFLSQWPAEYGQATAGITLTNRNRINGQLVGSAEVYFNNQFFDWSTNGAEGTSDIEGVAAHEFGHAIGLGHSFYFDATMYWSGGDQQLRTLSDDDIRGVRYLYGNGTGQGRLCDTCLSASDCTSGASCIDFGNGRGNCGQACNPNGSGADCPPNSYCGRLSDNSPSCIPDALVCGSDAQTANIQPGQYCFGADQCAGQSQCVPLESTAECIAACDPNRSNCPGGGECYATGNPDSPGLCILPGDVGINGTCGSIENRCRADLECAYFRDRVSCQKFCEPGGSCPQGYGCSPYGSDRWVCVSLDGAGEGEPCNEGLCAGGLSCRYTEFSGPICARACSLDAPSTCGISACLAQNDGTGVCSPGANNDGETCEQAEDCLGGLCLRRGARKECARPCDDGRACPENYTCEELGGGRLICFEMNNDEPVEIIDSGVPMEPVELDMMVTNENTMPNSFDRGSVVSSGETDASVNNGPVIFFDDGQDSSGCQTMLWAHNGIRLQFALLILLMFLNIGRSWRVSSTGGPK